MTLAADVVISKTVWYLLDQATEAPKDNAVNKRTHDVPVDCSNCDELEAMKYSLKWDLLMNFGGFLLIVALRISGSMTCGTKREAFRLQHVNCIWSRFFNVRHNKLVFSLWLVFSLGAREKSTY